MYCSYLSRGTYAGALSILIVALTLGIGACGGTSATGFDDASSPQGDSGIVPPASDGAPGADSPTSTGSDANVADSPAVDVVAVDSSPAETGSDTGGVVASDDGFGPERTACINTINLLRSMQGLPAYKLLNTDTIDTCLDEQATNDESMNSPHYSIINGTYPACDFVPTGPFNAQDECEGYGNIVGEPGSGAHGAHGTGIVGCLYDMWDEQYNSNCLGCVGCTAFGGACADCDYSGTKGPECGHYVNMSASYFTTAACGFAPAGTWATQNFY